MKDLHAQKVALTFGLLISGMHILWSVLILVGFAQPLVDFIFWAHMIIPPFHVTEFAITQALLLIVVTFFVGYGMGYMFALLWNKTHK